jgi:hypothetical protein
MSPFVWGGDAVKVLAGLIIVMALVIGIVPQFANCEAGGTTSMPAGTQASSGAGTAAAATSPVPKMKCLWTARAELGAAIPLFALGALMFVSRRRETRRALAVPSALLGMVAMLLPTALIGVCASSGAVCHSSMLPMMLVAGGLTAASSLAYLAANEVGSDKMAVATAES